MHGGDIRVKVPICIEPDGDEFHAFAPDLKGCHVGGATVEEAKRNLDDALHLYLSSLLARGEPLPIGCQTEIACTTQPIGEATPPLPGIAAPDTAPIKEQRDLSIRVSA